MREHVAECLKGRSALVALSGGVDSVVLLHLLLALRAQVVAAHVEHGMRGENSRRDCAFVEALCARLGVPLAVALVLLPWRLKRLAKHELKPLVRDMKSPSNYFAAAIDVLYKGAFSRDTFAIFLLATAFYLVFYAWPYANQSITTIDTAVVDLDHTP